ncbi:lysophospholipase L1-like esterase [Promicromonospora sp. AC04]|uniref:rhamnogalacturonan acetylesterase n=1 Tax=Promicromonospora sp. AC04 TaxID=2135723 RepID=UPI000D489816|nr:rhamnogalacturonan acetylesterase [Promicromonospora sp. AC04]PUB29046.1 lysophospholipase L1-like esterase [Promicromonospora sp. AC04]
MRGTDVGMPASMTRRFLLAALAAAGPLALTASAPPAATSTPADAAAPTAARKAKSQVQHPPRIHIAGDSTAAQKYADVFPETGWGMALPWYVAPRIEVVNHAMNGRSSRSFIAEGRLDVILDAIRPGDVLLVQFGHNDQKSDPDVGTEPWTTYPSYLRRYLDGARGRGARPVLLTPAERRRFDAAGDVVATHGFYPDAMRALAAAEGVPLIDITAQTIALWQELGLDGSKLSFLHTYEGREDNTHFNAPGAGVVARMVARGLLAAGVLAEDGVRRLYETVPVEWFTWPEDPPAAT